MNLIIWITKWKTKNKPLIKLTISLIGQFTLNLQMNFMGKICNGELFTILLFRNGDQMENSLPKILKRSTNFYVNTLRPRKWEFLKIRTNFQCMNFFFPCKSTSKIRIPRKSPEWIQHTNFYRLHALILVFEFCMPIIVYIHFFCCCCSIGM